MARGGVARRLASATVAATAALAVASGCVADPPPAADHTVGGKVSDDADLSGGVSVAVDRLDPGLNPHLLSDLGRATDLVASLTLPSAFRPAPDGSPVLDSDLLESADVVSQSPFVVRYVIRQRAQWSDATPIGAEDFEYLWQQMVSQPGVVDPDGYEHIRAVRSGAGGKTVDVQFDAPFARWRTLFADLVPAHLFKDTPGGFAKAMAGGSTVSGGPFMLHASDFGRGLLDFVRNDRYWAAAPSAPRVVVRRVDGAQTFGQALRATPATLGVVGDTVGNEAVVETVGGQSTVTRPATEQIELDFDATSPRVGDPALRAALGQALDPAVIARVVTGGDHADRSDFPFPVTSSAPTGRPDAVAAALTALGFTRDDDRWTRAGTTLSLTIGVTAGDASSVAAAYAVADELRAVGVGARVWELAPVDLFADALPHALVDAVVVRQPTVGDAVVAARSRFGCPPAPADGVAVPTRTPSTSTQLVPPPPDLGTQGPTPSAEPTPPNPRVTPPAGLGAARASDVAGMCDPAIDAALERADASADPAPALADAAARVAALAIRFPLVRPRFLVVQGPGLDGVQPDARSDPAATVGDVFRSARDWRIS